MSVADHMSDFNKKAQRWAEPYGDDVATAWKECWRGDWQLHLAARLGVEAGLLVLASTDMARLALERTGDDPRGNAALDHAVEVLHGADLDDAIRADVGAAADQEETSAASACRAACDALEAAAAHSRGEDVTELCVNSAKMAATGLTFVAPGPRVHRKLARLVRERIPQP